jgi:integrase
MPRIAITDQFALVKRKGSDRWYLEWREGGEKVRRSTGTGDAGEARERARELILGGVEIRDAAPDEIALVDVLDRYWLQHACELASAATEKRAIALWKEHWGRAPVSACAVTAQEGFVRWLAKKGLSDGYLRRVLGVGKAALNRAWQRGEVQQVPFVKLPPMGEAYPETATREQLVALLNAPMPAHLRTYCLIRLATGCRGDAALDLQPFQIDRRHRLIRLNPPGRRQTKKVRATVPLVDRLAQHLDSLGAEAYFVHWHGAKVASLKTTWRKVVKAAGLPGFPPKVLRHTVATELRRRGVPAWEVAGLLGHRQAGTSEIYAKFDPDYLGKARVALEDWLGDLARDVPWLGATAGSVIATDLPYVPPQTRAVAGFGVVGGTGFEPVTPTMSRSAKIKRIKD